MRYNGGPYIVHAEQSLILGHHSIAWLGQDANKCLFIQAVQRNDNRKTANKLWDHSKLNQVPGLNVLQQPVLLLNLGHCVRLPAAVRQVCCSSCTPPFPQVRGSPKTQILK